MISFGADSHLKERTGVAAIDEESLFNRQIDVNVTEDGGKLRLKGRLSDTRMGVPLHGIEVEMLVDAMEGKLPETSI